MDSSAFNESIEAVQRVRFGNTISASNTAPPQRNPQLAAQLRIDGSQTKDPICLLSSSDEETTNDNEWDCDCGNEEKEKQRSELTKDEKDLARLLVRQKFCGNPKDHILFQSMRVPDYMYGKFMEYFDSIKPTGDNGLVPSARGSTQPSKLWAAKSHGHQRVPRKSGDTSVFPMSNRDSFISVPKRAKQTARKSAKRKLILHKSVLETCSEINEIPPTLPREDTAKSDSKATRPKEDLDLSNSRLQLEGGSSESEQEDYLTPSDEGTNNEIHTPCRRRKHTQIDYNEDSSANEQVLGAEGSAGKAGTGLESSSFTGTLDLEAMNDIPFLRRYEIVGGLPRETISVHSSDGNFIYEFEFSVAKSRIPHGGYGAFIKLAAVYKLKQHLRKKRKKCFDETDLREVLTQRPLSASHPNGHGIQVTLTGRNLHGNYNSKFWPKEAVLVASNRVFNRQELQWETRKTIVNVVGRNLHYDAEEESRMQQPNSFGSLRQHMWQDYERVPDNIASFSSRYPGCGFVKLGRYGPFRKEDRKQKDDYDLKTFIFDQEPSGWSFGVSEDLRGAKQIVDITDDITGETHELAKAHIPMYVNECGHSPHLVQNVHSREENDRNVIYYVDIRNAMKAGVSVELLTDYFSHYEMVRKRKGYGEDNIKGIVKSDAHEASRLKRDCKEREEIASLIRRLTAMEIFHRLQFLNERIRIPLDDLLQEGMNQKTTAGNVTDRQLKARVRLHWLARLFLERIAKIESSDGNLRLRRYGKSMVSDQGRRVVMLMLEEAKHLARNLQWSRTVSAHFTRNSTNFQKVWEKETIEEMLYCIGNTIPFAMDTNVWCPLTRHYIGRVLIDLSEFVTKGICCDDFVEIFKILRRHTSELVACLKEHARGGELCLLSFSHGSEGGLFINPADNTHLSDYGIDGNSSVLKGALSVLSDFTQGGAPSSSVGKTAEDAHRLEVHDCVVVAADASSRAMDPHRGYPKLLQYFKEGSIEVNTPWYALWQAVHPVYQIGKGLLRLANLGSCVHFEEVLLRLLCDAAGIDSIQKVDLQRNSFPVVSRGPRMIFRPSPVLSFDPSTLPIEKEQSNRSVGYGGVRKWIFDGVVLKTLQSLGWKLMRCSHLADYRYIPPRGENYCEKERVLCSVEDVVRFCRRDMKWKGHSGLQETLDLYDSCLRCWQTSSIHTGDTSIAELVARARSR